MIGKYGWFHSLMVSANNDPKLVDYWEVQPVTKLLQYMAYLQDLNSKDAVNV